MFTRLLIAKRTDPEACFMPTKEIEEITRQIDRITFDAPAPKKTDESEKTRNEAHFKRILVAVDGSTSATRALEWAIHLGKAHEAHVGVVLVLPQQHAIHGTTLPAVNPRSAKLWTDLVKEEEASAHRILESAVEDCKQAGVRAQMHLERGPIVSAIARLAETQESDLVIVGSHGRRGLQRFLIGSVAEGVRDHAHTNVLIVRGEPPPKRILLGVDGSPPSRKAGRVVAELMEKSSSHVHVVHVVHSPIEGLEPEMQEKWRRAAQDLREPLKEHAQFPRGSWVHYDVHFGEPADELLRVEEDAGADLIVIGCRGLSGLQSLVAGSISRRVSHHAKTSVLVVK